MMENSEQCTNSEAPAVDERGISVSSCLFTGPRRRKSGEEVAIFDHTADLTEVPQCVTVLFQLCLGNTLNLAYFQERCTVGEARLGALCVSD